jgi:hypothetical protein
VVWSWGVNRRLAAVALDYYVGVHQRGVDPGQVVSHPARLPQQLQLARCQLVGSGDGLPQGPPRLIQAARCTRTAHVTDCAHVIAGMGSRIVRTILPAAASWDGEPSGRRFDVALAPSSALSLGAGACAGAAVVGCLVLDDMSADDNAVLDGVGAGIGVDRAVRLERA